MPEAATRTCSIILCTRNRAQSLRRTLRALSQIQVPPNLKTELILVDNNSTDETAEVIAAAWPQNMNCRSIVVPAPGLAVARNAGIAAAGGDVLVFIDDDVMPLEYWLELLCKPILRNEADAVVGRVMLAPQRVRQWMTQLHRSWLAESPPASGADATRLVGANMAIARTVLKIVRRFDPELGAGRLGFGEDTLFGEQLVRAGMKVVRANDAIVEHHFDPQRLKHCQWIESARKQGRSSAYIDYHWRQKPVRPKALRLRLWVTKARLWFWHARHPGEVCRRQGADAQLLGRVQFIEYCRQLLRERGRKRAYSALEADNKTAPVAPAAIGELSSDIV